MRFEGRIEHVYKLLGLGQRFVRFPISDDEFPHFLWGVEVQKYTIPEADLDTVQAALMTHWGFSTLRPYQIGPVLDLWKGHDLCAVLPTGGGKSICFQLPAVLRGGLCLVISPLLALMHDQVRGLRTRGLRAKALTSELDAEAAAQIYDDAISGHLRFLYVAPERLNHPAFLERLPYLPIRTVAVDEAHCISQWGHDFRPAYRQILALRAHLKDAVWGAYTATATQEVVHDLVEQLGLSGASLHRSPMRRPNLAYAVARSGDPEATLLEAAERTPGTGLIYVGTRVDAEKWSHRLQSLGLSAASYHAGLTRSEKDRRLRSWLDGQLRMLACTNAFGMGIDKPDVRWVFHAHLPSDLESYVQEAGRAGRDGASAQCVIFPSEFARKRTERRCAERFPDVQLIRSVYQAVANQGSVAIGDLPERPTPFDVRSWAETHAVPAATARAALDACARAGHFSVREVRNRLEGEVILFIGAAEVPSAAQEDPLARELLRRLLPGRNLPVAVSPDELASQLHVPATEVLGLLERFDRTGVLEWKPVPPGLRITWLQHRIPVDRLPLPASVGPDRAKQVWSKWEDVLHYLERTDCRSAALDRYFGESAPEPCGVCDRCTLDLPALRTSLLQRIPPAGIEADALLRSIPPLERDGAIEALRALRADQMLYTRGRTVYLY